MNRAGKPGSRPLIASVGTSSGGRPSMSTNTQGSSPGGRRAAATSRMPGSAKSRRVSSRWRLPKSSACCRPSSSATRAVANSSAAKPGPTAPVRSVPQASSAASGSTPTEKATCAITSVVHVAPNRRLVRPASAPAPSRARRPVAWSAGTMPDMAAPATASPATKRRVRYETSKVIQNGMPPGMFCRRPATTTDTMRRISSATPAAATVSRSASMKSCQTIRARLPPRAWRAANSCCRVTVRA